MKKISGKDTPFKNLRFDRMERRKDPKSQNQKPGEEGRLRGISIRKVLQMQTDNSNDQNPRRDLQLGENSSEGNDLLLSRDYKLDLGKKLLVLWLERQQ